MKIFKTPEITYSDVLDYEKCKKLYLQFNEYDASEHYKNTGKLKEVILYQTYNIELSEPYFDDVNEVSTQDLSTTKDKLVELHINNDFLFPGLDKFRIQEIGRIELRRKNEKKYSGEERKGFYNELSSEYSLIFDEIEQCNFHNNIVKDKLREIILEIKDYLEEEIELLSNIEKIPLNFTNEEIAIIFGRLYAHGHIPGISVPKLGSLLSLYFSQKEGKNISPSIRNKINKYSKHLPTSEKKQSYFIDLFTDLFSE